MRSVAIIAAITCGRAAALQARPRDCFLLSSFSDGVLARPEVGALLRDAVQLQTGSVDARIRLTYIPTAMYALRRERASSGRGRVGTASRSATAR